jgi:hypothetical protein
MAWVIEKRIRLLLAVFCLESIVTALVVTFPWQKDWLILLMPFIVPGYILTFLIGGGNSMMDGISPDWRVNLGLGAGFLFNTAIMYGFCLVVSKCYKIARPQFGSKDLK